jgi:hypothetical protein
MQQGEVSEFNGKMTGNLGIIMKSVKYEGFYHCMHNHSTGICSYLSRRKIDRLALNSQWMKKWQEEAGNNQFL